VIEFLHPRDYVEYGKTNSCNNKQSYATQIFVEKSITLRVVKALNFFKSYINALLMHIADLSSSLYGKCCISCFQLLCKLLLYRIAPAVIGLISACGQRMDGPNWWT